MTLEPREVAMRLGALLFGGSRRSLIALMSSSIVIVSLVAAARSAPPVSDRAPAGVEETQDVPSTGDPRQSTRSTGARAAEGADPRKTAAADIEGRARTTGRLTTRQKRLFVLGLWAAEKKARQER